MSPQSTLCESSSSSFHGDSYERFAYLSELVQAADESFSMHRRLDSHQDPPPIESFSNIFPLKKRKVSIYSSPSEEIHPNYNADFLSAIFQDVADIIQANEIQIDQPLNQTASNKKLCVSATKQLNRCSKSYACLSCSSSSCVDSNPSSEVSTSDLGSRDLSSGQCLDEISFFLPNLPATISENSCSVVNLTQTSVRAAQVHETSPSNFIYGVTSPNKDSYGWFVEIDDAPDDALKNEQAPSIVPKDKIKDDLSFSVCTAPKKNPAYDAAVEWAKAADTVDNVLGDLPF